MITANLENEVVVLYDRLHEFYVNCIRFMDVCPISEGDEYIHKLHKVINTVDDCMIAIALGGMGTINFLDEVNMNELYMTVFCIASEIHNAVIEGPDSDDLAVLRNRIHDNVNAIYTAIQDIMQIFLEVLNN